MSDKIEVAKEIKKWCNTEFKSNFWRWAVNWEGDEDETIHVALIMKIERTPEINSRIAHMTSAVKKKFPAENLDIGVYDKKETKKRPTDT